MPYDIDIISEEAIVCRIKLDRLLLWMSKVFLMRSWAKLEARSISKHSLSGFYAFFSFIYRFLAKIYDNLFTPIYWQSKLNLMLNGTFFLLMFDCFNLTNYKLLQEYITNSQVF